MGCETGLCEESCRVDVGAIYVVPPQPLFLGLRTRPAYHLFVLYHTADGRQIVYRGGPELNNKYSEAAAQGQAQEYSAPADEAWDVETPLGALITHRMEGRSNNQDLLLMVDSVTIAEGPDYCGLDEDFTRYTRMIGELGMEYEPISALSIDNSNATVRTILRYIGLPEERPTGGKWVDMFGFEHDRATAFAPGWGRVFDLD